MCLKNEYVWGPSTGFYCYLRVGMVISPVGNTQEIWDGNQIVPQGKGTNRRLSVCYEINRNTRPSVDRYHPYTRMECSDLYETSHEEQKRDGTIMINGQRWQIRLMITGVYRLISEDIDVWFPSNSCLDGTRYFFLGCSLFRTSRFLSRYRKPLIFTHEVFSDEATFIEMSSYDSKYTTTMWTCCRIYPLIHWSSTTKVVSRSTLQLLLCCCQNNISPLPELCLCFLDFNMTHVHLSFTGSFSVLPS